MKKDIVGEIVNEGLFLGFNEDRFIGVYQKVDEGDIIGKAKFVLQPIEN